MTRGVLWGQVTVILAASVATVLVVSAASPGQLLDDFGRAGARLLQIYLPYAGVIALAFSLRIVQSVDLRSLTSVLVFGPLTLIRPAVALGGAAWALVHMPRAEVAIMVGVILPMMLFLERFLNWRNE